MGVMDDFCDDDGQSDEEPAPLKASDPWAPKSAVTAFECLGVLASGFASLVRCRLEGGGRTHQIRRHLVHCGHPIVGDARYGCSVANRYMKKHLAASRLFLHAWQLKLQPPGGEDRLVLEAPLPVEYIRALGKLDGGEDALRNLQSTVLQA